MFLLAREAGIGQRERYWFVPYNYGPMSPALYRDLDRMEGAPARDSRPFGGAQSAVGGTRICY